jgi:hypothetical protein
VVAVEPRRPGTVQNSTEINCQLVRSLILGSQEETPIVSHRTESEAAFGEVKIHTGHLAALNAADRSDDRSGRGRASVEAAHRNVLGISTRVKVDGRPVTSRRSFPETAVNDVEIAAVVAEGTTVAGKNNNNTGDGRCPEKSGSCEFNVANFGRFDQDRSTDPTLQINEKTMFHNEAIHGVILEARALCAVNGGAGAVCSRRCRESKKKEQEEEHCRHPANGRDRM